MGYYGDLAEIATKQAEDFYKSRDQCARVAARLAQELVGYLAAPEERISFAQLDDDLLRTGDLVPTGGLPKMTMGNDKRWYCGINVHFASNQRLAFSSVTLTIGIMPQDTRYSVKFIRDFVIDPAVPNAFTPLLDHIYSELKNDYTRGLGEPRSVIGFMHGRASGE